MKRQEALRVLGVGYRRPSYCPRPKRWRAIKAARCKWCEGAGSFWSWYNKPSIPCDACNGTGCAKTTARMLNIKGEMACPVAAKYWGE